MARVRADRRRIASGRHNQPAPDPPLTSHTAPGARQLSLRGTLQLCPNGNETAA
jgi:hypothetical protein